MHTYHMNINQSRPDITPYDHSSAVGAGPVGAEELDLPFNALQRGRDFCNVLYKPNFVYFKDNLSFA